MFKKISIVKYIMQVSLNRDIKMTENLVKNLAMDYITFTIADNIPGVVNIINNQENMYIRNLQRGAFWYVAKEVQNDIVTGTSNLRAMDLKVAVDDTLFNALASVIIDSIGQNVNNSIASIVPNGIDSSRLTSALILSGVRMAGDNLGFSNANNPIGNFTQKWLGL